MTLKEFLETNTITAVDTINGFDLIINVYVDGACYGLNIDTSNVPAGTLLTTREDFNIVRDILSVDGISINVFKTEMLG